jgi:hypothetical protein
MDPARAQADVDDSMREKGYTFCRSPHEPLSSPAMELCAHASAAPDCAGYAAACATPPPPPAPWKPPWWLRWLAVPGWVGTLAQALVWLLVGALVVAVLVPIVRGLSKLRTREPLPPRRNESANQLGPVVVEPEVVTLSDEDQILARARELAQHGDLAGAMQLYLVASLRALDKRGALRLAKDRTNGEYVRACTDGTAKPALREIVREVDRVQFGGESATTEGLERAARQALAIVRAAPVAMLALALVLACAGCGGTSVPHPRHDGDDPAGEELFHDVLARQGVKLAHLETSLATMPLPEPGVRTPAVIVDLDRTNLDDESREHLLAWVDAGGVLVLAGFPMYWPKELKAEYATSALPHKLTARRLLARATPHEPGQDDDEAEEEEESAVYAPTEEHGELVSGRGLKLAGDRIAWFGDGTPYATAVTRGRGLVVGLASDELMKNAALVHPGNAGVLVAILASAGRTDMRLAEEEDGVSPPSTPIAALLRAGLGLALAHAVVFGIVLFVAVGTRQARPKPVPPPRRRAFSEHVEAVGALYARARSSPHALAAYARFADERIRGRMPRGMGDVPAFLASRARVPLDACQRVWARAMQAKAGAPPLGDELAVLRELSALYAVAMAQDR